MDGTSQTGSGTGPSEVADLRRAVAVLSREVGTLAERAARLTLAVERMAPAEAPAPMVASPQAPPAIDGDGSPPAAETVPFRVVVAPVPELALAAVAETALRSMPQVRRVTDVTHSDQEAIFDLELEAGADVAESLRVALPVSFRVVDSSTTDLVISLRPVWGPDASA